MCNRFRHGARSGRACIISAVALLVGAALPASANALCLDPKTLISGYRMPLADEIQASQAIVVAEVIRSKALQEDSSDPEGITATVYTARVLRRIKGRAPLLLVMKIDNDSGRYAMDVGERHLLFLSKSRLSYSVDSCGNSSPLPEGAGLLRDVEERMGQAILKPQR